MAPGYTVKLVQFEGPLNLLLNLIERRKFHINDISLASVADDFLAYLKEGESFPVAESAEFVAIASTLLLIKAKSLIPTIEITPEERETAEELEHRLALLRRYRALGVHIAERYGARKIFERDPRVDERRIFSPGESTSKASLLEAVRRVIAALPRPIVIPQAVVKSIVRLEDVIENLVARVQKSISMSFNAFTRGRNAADAREARVNIVVSFLALLELVRRGLLAAEQSSHFRDITIESRSYSVPRYGE